MATRKKNNTKPKEEDATSTSNVHQIDAFAPDIEDPETFLIEAVEESPGKYTYLRVYQVETTVNVTSGLAKHIRRGELGREPLNVLKVPGIYHTLSTKYGGGEGVCFDVSLVRADNKLGPTKRFGSPIDRRPPNLQRGQQVWGDPQSQQGQPWAGGWGYGPPGAPPSPWGGYTPPPAAQAPSTESKLLETLAVAAIPFIFETLKENKNSTAEGVRVGMDLAEKIAEAGGARSLGGEIAGAVRDSVEAVANAWSSSSAFSGRKKKTNVAAPSKDDLETLGWLVTSSIQQKWPTAKTARILISILSPETVADLIETPIKAVQLMHDALEAYPPLEEVRDDVKEWAFVTFQYVSDHYGVREPDDVEE